MALHGVAQSRPTGAAPRRRFSWPACATVQLAGTLRLDTVPGANSHIQRCTRLAGDANARCSYALHAAQRRGRAPCWPKAVRPWCWTPCRESQIPLPAPMTSAATSATTSGPTSGPTSATTVPLHGKRALITGASGTLGSGHRRAAWHAQGAHRAAARPTRARDALECIGRRSCAPPAARPSTCVFDLSDDAAARAQAVSRRCCRAGRCRSSSTTPARTTTPCSRA